MAGQELMTGDELGAKLVEMADALVDWAGGAPERAALVGIERRGALLARRLQAILAQRRGWKLPVGLLDITLYRDDLSQLASNPLVRKTQLDFDVTGRTILLVDDVVYTGRTARCAVTELLDFGRPKAIRLAVVVDRGGRELPIQPDFAALRVDATETQVVKVMMTELDGHDQVLLASRASGETETETGQ
jgi:pyrimidine operon attenuation protein / uracil phosphoribosyltransferase